MSTYEHLQVEHIEDGRVLRLVLDHPKGNVLDAALMGELDAALAAHRDEQPLKLVIIGAAGKHFSFGASVEEHQKHLAAGMLQSFHALIRTVASYPVPIAAAVQGRCLGGAFELALACNFVFAATSARFACPEIKLGVFPPVLAALGPVRFGAAWTERLVLTGAELDATTAQRIGLVTQIASDDETPMDAALTWYRSDLEPLSAFSLRVALAATRDGSDMPRLLGDVLARIETRYVDTLLPSHDGNEGIDAFIAKRAPAWKDV